MRCMGSRIALSAALAATLAAGAAAADRKTVEDVKARQVALQQAIVELAKTMETKTDAERQVRATLYSLTANEMAEAVRLLEALPGLQGPESEAAARGVVERQDRVIQALEKVLGVVNLLETHTREAIAEKPGTDLPPDLEAKLKDLQKGLEKFQEEQKKVIEETNNLAKQPVENFGAPEEEKLKELAAIEDKWAQFLKEAYSDLSRLPIQDYANPSLLEEIVQTYSEVEMAKDALQKKAVEIATPLEENGAELAESIETNIEKWLPDTPDRDQWKMEEPLEDFHSPMAELPKELQDLVGDLMEQEEDLMSDIEDATSSWAGSFDKGVGWDTMDGPISSMTAKGVTGNRLPNSSEIGGRSGEGRTGKSGGEFVGEEAVGKGGRRTPTRLTPDPFERGEVKDVSQEPPGGATGGGKISGAGSEGLEGPVPPDLDRTMGALAGRQAELRNKAEKIRAAFEVLNYPTAEISDVVKLMESIEQEVRSRRYQNIARVKPILLKNLDTTRRFLEGEMHVHHDRGLGLPKHMQDELISALDEEAPAGYKELLRGYYESLNRVP